jgi:hypothetical protein
MKKSLAMLGILIFLTTLSRGATLSFTNTAGGSWHLAANWSPNQVPFSSDNAMITNAGSYLVFVTNANAFHIVVSGGPQLTVFKSSSLTAGDCTVSGGSSLVLSNNSTLNLTGGCTVNATGGLIANNNSTLNLAGSCAVNAGGSLIASNNSTLSLSSNCTMNVGGLMSLDTSAGLAGGTLTVTNSGTIALSNNATFAPLNCLNVNGGTLTVDANARLTSGNYFVATGGVLNIGDAWAANFISVQPGGQLNLYGASGATLYSLTISNQGTVNWSSGTLTIGSTPTTQIYNNGLWLITGNNGTSHGGGLQPTWVNNGILRKSGGTGVSGMNSFNFLNQASGAVDAQVGTLTFNGGPTNLLAGVFTNSPSATINLANGTWSDAGAIFNGAGVNIFSGGVNNGVFFLRTNPPPGLKFTGGDVWVSGPTFQNAGTITNLAIDGATLRGTNTVTGVLNYSAGSIPEKLIVASNGLVITTGPANKFFYGATIINQGTILIGATVNLGPANISNSGLWQFTGDYGAASGGGGVINWTNIGIIRKTSGLANGSSRIDGNFINLPGGLVDCQAGHLVFTLDSASQFGGTFNATGFIELSGGTGTDAGGVATGTGTNRFVGGTFNLRTNVPPGLILAGGNVVVTGTNSFQNSGAITNLTLDGATLAGNHFVNGGTLTLNAGSISGQLTVQTNGQLLFAGNSGKFITSLVLTNLGTVTMNSASVSSGTTAIYNFGVWQMPGDFGLSYGGVGVNAFTNFGTFRKTGGTGNSDNSTIRFFNQTGALVQVDSGTLLLPSASTNFAGTLRMNGGAFGVNFGGTFNVAGGMLDGAGTFGQNVFSGGTISPGINGSGQIKFSAGLNLSSNVTLALDGITAASGGAGYDTLVVTGAVNLANATLQITALPSVAAGTKFTLIDNDGADAVSGTFFGLPENFSITNGGQTFRIHYAGGTGNDVTLVRDGVITGPRLAMNFYANNAWTFTGSNAIPLTVFTVRASTNLLSWTNIGVVTSSVSGGWSFTDTNAWRFTRRFYNTTN